MKVTFTHSSGRQQPMDERYAKVLQKMRRGTYMTRDIVSAEPEQSTEPEYVDSAGVLWSAELHTSTMLKNQDGTWRKKPGKAKE